jgi:hypothetical protein
MERRINEIGRSFHVLKGIVFHGPSLNFLADIYACSFIFRHESIAPINPNSAF